MKKHSRALRQDYAAQVNGFWIFRLPDPYRQMPWLPIDATTLSNSLGISYRSALRVCKGEKSLPPQQLTYLQILHFGYIPDPEFLRGRWFIRSGQLISHRLSGHAFDAGELMELAVLLPQYRRMMADMEAARGRLAESEALRQRYERLRLRYRDTVRELKAARRRVAELEGPDMSNVLPFRRR